MSMYDPYTAFKKTRLENGLEVHSVFWDRPWVGMEVVVHSGAREDPLGMPGLAHFVEHCVSRNIPDREGEEVRQFFESVGGYVSFGSTGYLATRYSFAVPADPDIFRKALDIFGSMLLEAQIKKEIENQRKIIFREFNQRYPFIEKLGWDMDLRQNLFREHRLETYNNPLGRPEGFLFAKEKDLQNFYDEHYTPQNMSMVIIGGFRDEEVIAEIEKSPFGKQKEGKRNPISAAFTGIMIWGDMGVPRELSYSGAQSIYQCPQQYSDGGNSP